MHEDSLTSNNKQTGTALSKTSIWWDKSLLVLTTIFCPWAMLVLEQNVLDYKTAHADLDIQIMIMCSVFEIKSVRQKRLHLRFPQSQHLSVWSLTCCNMTAFVILPGGWLRASCMQATEDKKLVVWLIKTQPKLVYHFQAASVICMKGVSVYLSDGRLTISFYSSWNIITFVQWNKFN